MHEPADVRAPGDSSQIMTNGREFSNQQFVNPQSGTRALLCMAGMLLLGVGYARRRCDYSTILSSYRQLIFPELQSLNLTGPFSTSKENDGCPSNKVTRIVRSIYRMTEQFMCLSDGLQGSETAVVVSKMSQLIKLYCGKTSTEPAGRGAKPCKAVRRKKKARIEQGRKMIRRLISCWQKLQSVYS